MLLGNNLLSRHSSLLQKYGGATWSRTKNVYHEGTDLQSADAHAIASIAPYLVDRRGIEPRLKACKAPVLPLSLPAQILASREGLEPPRTVLETVMLPLHHPDNFNTLFRMCVLKHTVITTILPRLTADVSVQYALIRSDFFMYKNISHPRGRPFVV